MFDECRGGFQRVCRLFDLLIVSVGIERCRVCCSVLKLIAQFLKEHGLKKTLGALQDETQVAYNAVEDKKKVTQMVVDGNWEELIREVGSLYLPRGFLMDLYEHVGFKFKRFSPDNVF